MAFNAIGSRARLLVICAALVVFGVALLVKAFEANQTGKISVLWRVYGTQTFSVATDPNYFYQSLWIAFASGSLMLCIGVGVALLTLFKKNFAIEQAAVAQLERSVPSGLKRLWLGLFIAALAFVAYVVV